MHYFQRVFDEISKAALFGKSRTRNGAMLYGHMKWKGPDAWFHSIFPSLDHHEQKGMQSDLQTEIPEDLADFYALSNGLILFAGSFCVYGRRSGPSYDPEIRVPYDIVPVNRFERPRGMGKEMLILGGYRWKSGGYFAINVNDRRLIACARKDATALFEWPSFEAFLLSEVTRLGALFDDTGRKRDLGKSEFPWEM